MLDLSTSYLGLNLKSPLVPSASPLTQELDNIRHLEDAGAAALVFHSVFEEIALNGNASAGSALDHYLSYIRRAKEAVEVPIIASLGATTLNGWIEYAKQIEQTGADALEVNLYQVPSQADVTGSQLEDAYVEIVKTVKSAVKIPVAAKLTPYFTSMSNMARRFDEAGADGLVLFNRFYQPDINLEGMTIEPNVLLSTSQDLRLPLTWTGMLYGRIKANLAATSGVHSHEDVVKLVLVGADITMMCSALLRHGIDHLSKIENGLRFWMEKHRYKSVGEMRGNLSQLRSPDPATFERAQYLNAVKGVQNVVVTGREAWRILTGQ